MRVTRIAVAAAGLIVFTVALLPQAGVHGAQNSPPTSSGDHILAIGVVNMFKVVQNMKEYRRAHDDARAKNESFIQEQQRREQEIKKLYNDRGNLKPGSSQWYDATKNIDKASAETDIWAAMTKREFERQQKLRLKTIYDHITAASAAVAQRHHLNLVIADESPEIGPDLDGITAPALEQILAGRAVLYADKKADITEEVLTTVEANYAQQNSDGGHAAALINPVRTGK